MGNVREAVRRIENAMEYKLRCLSLNRLGLSDDELPISVGQMSGLTKLDLSGNQLTVFPDCITPLTRLTTLTLADNQLTALPESIARLKAFDYT